MALRRNIAHHHSSRLSRALRISLIVLIILAGLIGAFIFWFNGQHVRDPLLKILAERSGMTFTVGKVEFSPLYPDTLKLHDIGFGNSTIDELYAEYDVRSLLSGNDLVIRDLYVKNLKTKHGDISRLTRGRLGFKTIKINALHATDVPLDFDALKARTSSFELKSLFIQSDGKTEIASGSGQMGEGSFKGLPFKSLEGKIERHGEKTEINSLRMETLGGTVSGDVTLTEPDTLTFSSLNLDRVVLKNGLNFLGKLTVTAPEVNVNSAVVLLPSRGITFEGLDGRILDLSYSDRTVSFIYSGRADEISIPDMQLTAEENRAELSVADTGADIKLAGSIFDGSYSLDAFATPKGALSVRALSLSGGKFELTPDLRDGFSKRISSPVTVGTLTLNNISFLSHLDSLRLSARTLSGTISGFSWSPDDGISPAPSGAASISASDVLFHDLRCNELSVISNFSSQGITISVPKAVFGQSHATFAMSLPLDDGKGFVIAQAKDFDASSLNSDLMPRTFGGNFDLDAQLQLQGPVKGFPSVLKGHISLQSASLLVSDFGLDLINGGKKGVYSLSWDKLNSALADSDCGFHDLMLQIDLTDSVGTLNATAMLPASKMSLHTQTDTSNGETTGEAFFASYPRDSLTSVTINGKLPDLNFEIDALERGPILRPGLFVKELTDKERKERDENLKKQAAAQQKSEQELMKSLEKLKSQIAELEGTSSPQKENTEKDK